MAFSRRRVGRPRKNAQARSAPRSSDLVREQRVSAISGRPPVLAGLDHKIRLAWSANDTAEYRRLEQDRNDIERSNSKMSADPRAATELGRLRLAGLIDDAQHRAGEAFERLAARYYGPIPGRPDDRTRSCLASLIGDSVSALSTLSEDDFATQRRRAWETLRESYARLWDWRMLESVVRFGEPLPIATAVIGGIERCPIDVLRRDLDELARQYRIDPDRGTGRR